MAWIRLAVDGCRITARMELSKLVIHRTKAEHWRRRVIVLSYKRNPGGTTAVTTNRATAKPSPTTTPAPGLTRLVRRGALGPYRAAASLVFRALDAAVLDERRHSAAAYAERETLATACRRFLEIHERKVKRDWLVLPDSPSAPAERRTRTAGKR